jgi:hypothetical protein
LPAVVLSPYDEAVEPVAVLRDRSGDSMGCQPPGAGSEREVADLDVAVPVDDIDGTVEL